MDEMRRKWNGICGVKEEMSAYNFIYYSFFSLVGEFILVSSLH